MKNRRLLSFAIASAAKWQVTPLENRMIVFSRGIGYQPT